MIINMKMIGITGQTGVGKTFLSNEFKNEDTLVIDIDKVIRKVSNNDFVIVDTINYLCAKYQIHPKDIASFWTEILMYSRKDINQLEDPLWGKAEKQIDLIIKSADTKRVIFDYSLLPKTKYFNMCDYNILLLPTSNEIRKKAIIKRDNLENDERLNMRDKYSIDYRSYNFNKIVINSYDKNQFSSLKDYILKEIETVNNIEKTNYTEPKEQ